MKAITHVVGIQESQIVKRAKLLECNPSEGISERPLIPLLEACRTKYSFDAHLLTYFLNTREEIPALAKNVFTLLKDRGYTLLTEVLALDADLDGKVEWTQSAYDDFTEDFINASPYLPMPTIFYTTEHGVRFVFALTQPIFVDEAECIHRGLAHKYSKYFKRDLKLDLLHNWDRVYRLPHVIRDNKKTWEADFFIYHEQLDCILDPSTIQPLGIVQSSPSGVGTIPDLPKPDAIECSKYLRTEKGKATEWFKTAKKYLKGRDCYPVIFEEEQPIAEEGHRDSTIQVYAGQCAAMLTGLQESTPEKIYALLLRSVQLLTPDNGTADWTDSLWKAILKYWTKEKDNLEKQEIEEADREQSKQDKLDLIVQAMQGWSTHPDLHSKLADVQRLFALSNLIVMTPTEYFVMTSTGYYHPVGTSRLSELPALIRRYDMDDIIQIEDFKNGNACLTSGPVILANHGIKIKDMIGKITAPGLYVENLGTERMQLISNLFSIREDLLETARFHPEVDRWLHALVEPEMYEALEAWISWALAFDEGPICALALFGPPGCGKKLFCQGLAECISTGEYATARDFGRFKETLLRTCFLVVDEGLPKPQQGVPDVADTFRHFVSGDPLQIEQKYKTPITIRNPIRIIFTSNNSDVIQELAGHRELTREDQEALAVRILHMRAQQDATNYLLSLGGIYHTKGWISGDAGELSDYVVARHFLWLYLHRRNNYPRQKRLLVEGSLTSNIMQEMKLRSGIAPQVVETLISMIEAKEQRTIGGMAVDKEQGEVWVTNKGVSDRFINLFPHQRPNGHALRKVLNNITIEQTKCRMRLIGGKISDNLCWRKVDLYLLLEEAIKNGIEHKKIDVYYKKQIEIQRESDILTDTEF